MIGDGDDDVRKRCRAYHVLRTHGGLQQHDLAGHQSPLLRAPCLRPPARPRRPHHPRTRPPPPPPQPTSRARRDPRKFLSTLILLGG